MFLCLRDRNDGLIGSSKIAHINARQYMLFIWPLLLKASHQPPRSFFVYVWKDRGKRLNKAREEERVDMDAVLSVHVFWILLRDTQRRQPTKSEAAQLPWTHGEMDRPALTASVVQQLPEPIIILP